MAGTPRLVVCTPYGPAEPFELPESVLVPEREFISGGERSIYELAVAAASLGIDVELRGAINPFVLNELVAAAGASPATGLPSRRPDRRDLMVICEAPDADLLATAHLSGGRWVLHMLAPPGLWGWSFQPGWADCDPMLVPVEAVGTPATFQAIHGLGYALWTNALGIAAAGARAGTPVEWIGTGTPVPFPEPGPRYYDLAVLRNNRWAAWADRVVDRLPGVSVTRIEATPNVYSLCGPLSEARLLVWPSRIEGMSRVPREARGVGTVPVALDTNPFALPDDHGRGVVLVDDLEGIVRETRALLDDPGRLDKLSAEAIDSARTQADWRAFMGRVETAIVTTLGRSDDDDPSRFARDRLGDHVRVRALENRVRVNQLQSDLDRTRAELETAQLGWTAAESQRDALARDREQLRLEYGRLADAHEEARSELAAYRSRLSTRVLERSRAGEVWNALKRRLQRS